jgi:uncharacterized protein
MHHKLAAIGIGLRHAHIAPLLALHPRLPRLGFVEVHAENYFAEGGAAREQLRQVRELYPVSLHGVGLSLGSAMGVDAAHLDKLAALVAWLNPALVSDHAAFARVPHPCGGTLHAADLLPVAFTPASIDILVANIQHVQERLARPLLLENLSAYMAYEDDQIPESEFLREVCERSGCRLLLDLNNLLVNGLNKARRASWQPGAPAFEGTVALTQARAEVLDAVWALPPELIGQIHLAGFRWPTEPNRLFIDDHSQRVSPTLWDIYEQCLIHLGERAATSTLIEWDTDLPPLAVLLDEARLAGEVMARVTGDVSGDVTGDMSAEPTGSDEDADWDGARDGS